MLRSKLGGGAKVVNHRATLCALDMTEGHQQVLGKMLEVNILPNIALAISCRF